MKPGTVLFDREFEFSDGTTGEKLFVLLSDGTEGNYISVKTTSQDKLYSVAGQCQITCRFPNYFIPKHAGIFEKHTWIQLDEFFELNKIWLDGEVGAGKIYRICELGTLTIPVLGCARDAPDIAGTQKTRVQNAIATLQAEAEEKKAPPARTPP